MRKRNQSHSKPRKEEKNNPVILSAVIGAVATILVALITVLGPTIQSYLSREVAQPTEVSVTKRVVSVLSANVDYTGVPTESLSKAIITVKHFFDGINSAADKQELKRSWDLQTIRKQCEDDTDCGYADFLDTWWNWKVRYQLYDCGDNVVHADVTYYVRDPLKQWDPQDNRTGFKILEQDGQWKIDQAWYLEAGIGASCELVATVP